MKGMSNLIYALIVVPMVLIIATAIFTQFGTSIDRGDWSAEANTTFTKVQSGTWSGFDLGSMLPFIFIAITVVGVILGAFGLRTYLGGR